MDELDRSTKWLEALKEENITAAKALNNKVGKEIISDFKQDAAHCKTILTALRQMGSTKPCEWCDKDGPETWNYTRSGKYIPEYQTPRNYCRACGRPLKGR